MRRLGLPAHRRDLGVPQDRGRGRRAPLVRHGAFLGPRRGRPASEPGARLRRGHLDHPQDARRPAGRLHPLPRGARLGDRPCHLPGIAGRPAGARDRRQGDLLQDRRLRGVPRVPDAGAGECRRTRSRDHGRRCRRPHRRHRHAPAPARPPSHGVDRQGRGGAAARRQADDESQHRSVRRAPADRGLGRADRDAGGDDARLRRRGLSRGGPDHRRRARRWSRRSRPGSAKRGPVRQAAVVRRASADTRPTDGQPRRRGRSPARSAQARPPARRHDDDAAVPPARQRADAAPHLRGDEDPGRRGGRDRDAARAHGCPPDQRQEGRRLPDPACGCRDARRRALVDPGRAGRVHRALSRRGDAPARRVLREAAERHRRARRAAPRSDAGDGQLDRGGRRDGEGRRRDARSG